LIQGCGGREYAKTIRIHQEVGWESAAKLLFNKNLTISTAATTTRNAAEVPTYKHLYNALEIFWVQTDGWE